MAVAQPGGKAGAAPEQRFHEIAANLAGAIGQPFWRMAAMVGEEQARRLHGAGGEDEQRGCYPVDLFSFAVLDRVNTAVRSAMNAGVSRPVASAWRMKVTSADPLSPSGQPRLQLAQ